jgi:hypothetical protein
VKKAETEQFISEVLGGLWPRWEPKKEEIDGWIFHLQPFDFLSAKHATNDLFFKITTRSIEPPAAKILACLRQTKRSPEQSEPVLLYTIMKESVYREGHNPAQYGKEFWVGSQKQVPAPEVIERMAERSRQQGIKIYGENCVIIRNWEEGGTKVPFEGRSSIPHAQSASGMGVQKIVAGASQTVEAPFVPNPDYVDGGIMPDEDDPIPF